MAKSHETLPDPQEFEMRRMTNKTSSLRADQPQLPPELIKAIIQNAADSLEKLLNQFPKHETLPFLIAKAYLNRHIKPILTLKTRKYFSKIGLSILEDIVSAYKTDEIEDLLLDKYDEYNEQQKQIMKAIPEEMRRLDYLCKAITCWTNAHQATHNLRKLNFLEHPKEDIEKILVEFLQHMKKFYAYLKQAGKNYEILFHTSTKCLNYSPICAIVGEILAYWKNLKIKPPLAFRLFSSKEAQEQDTLLYTELTAQKTMIIQSWLQLLCFEIFNPPERTDKLKQFITSFKANALSLAEHRNDENRHDPQKRKNPRASESGKLVINIANILGINADELFLLEKAPKNLDDPNIQAAAASTRPAL